MLSSAKTKKRRQSCRIRHGMHGGKRGHSGTTRTRPDRMTMASTQHMPQFDDDAWDDLLNYIEERRVIPILGPIMRMPGLPEVPASEGMDIDANGVVSGLS